MAHRSPRCDSRAACARRPIATILVIATAVSGCSKQVTALPTSPTDSVTAIGASDATSSTTTATSRIAAQSGTPGAPVRVVLFTHIEDNTPAGALSPPSTRAGYLAVRAALIDMGERTFRYKIPWTLQSDWKLLEAARQYEDAATMASTRGMNLLQYLRGHLGVTIDPHSHEGSGYNYTDVAYLLDQLGVGGSTVIGGHVWDPSLTQFQMWDRFRVPVPGSRYPMAIWRGDVLMGSGTPNHVSDPIVSGVWRPKDRYHYFDDDPAGNITAVGGFRGDAAGIAELVALSQTGVVAPTCMLTATYGIRPTDFLGPGGGALVDSSVLAPFASLRASGNVELTTFQSLVGTWRRQYGGQACIYDGAPR